jgi:Pregnancy-associated plasma protein-A
MEYGPAERRGTQEYGRQEIRRCVTMDEHWRLVRQDPEYRERSRRVERDIQDWVARYAAEGLRTGLIRIPVVVHVLFNTAAQNISDAQIQSQIAVLNQDFRRLNADAAATPAAFAGVAADARLEFALAVRDPNCNATNGITRTSTSATGWTFPGNDMKSAATNGVDPWDVTKYLNVWVVNYTDGTLGFGTFPAMPANIQGVVCDFRAFGTIGTLTPNAHLGRTMTHEVGHWLNLRHIWGDDGVACTGSDDVADTPNQAGSSPFAATCRTHPAPSCSNTGDMFMNYMDYSADQCVNMLTAGQAVRIDAAMHTARASIIASDGLVPPAAAAGPELWMQDVSDDIGAEPDASTQPMYLSNDIWVRTTNDGVLNQDHQNPEYRPPGAASNFVYVRVRNRGCSGTGTGTLKLYWAKASSGLSWPAPWDGSVTTPALMGGQIGTQSVSVAASDDQILIFPWMPPNPADYASFGADKGHFCLLARIETATSPPYGMTSPETSNLYANVQNNNKIVWKNITVVDEVPGSGLKAQGLVANFTGEPLRAALRFEAPEEGRPSVFEWARVFAELPIRLIEQLDDKQTKGVRRIDDTTLQILEHGARLGLFELGTEDFHVLDLSFDPYGKEPMGVRLFELDVLQLADEAVVGGIRFVLKTRPDRQDTPIDRPRTVFDGVTWVPVQGLGRE